MRRKRRDGEVVCRCYSYGFPHRLGGGRCNGSAFVADTFDRRAKDCHDCMFRYYCEDDMQERCEVEQQKEPPIRCPAFADLVDYEGIKLYGVNKP